MKKKTSLHYKVAWHLISKDFDARNIVNNRLLMCIQQIYYKINICQCVGLKNRRV